MLARPHSSPLFPYTTLFRSLRVESRVRHGVRSESPRRGGLEVLDVDPGDDAQGLEQAVGIGNRVGFTEGDADRRAVDDADVVSGSVGSGTCGFGVGQALGYT